MCVCLACSTVMRSLLQFLCVMLTRGDKSNVHEWCSV